MTDMLLADQALLPGESRTSTNGRFEFRYQTDGNLVLYKAYQFWHQYVVKARALWASDTANRAAGRCVMQNDGNLVIYGPSGEYIWDTATNGAIGARLVVQDDGNVVIYRPDGPAAWATNTVSPLPPSGPIASGDTMLAGQTLNLEGISSANGRYWLNYWDDLSVSKRYATSGFSTKWFVPRRSSSPPGACILQEDGNLVIYDGDGRYVWDSETNGNPGARLTVHNDGNVVIYGVEGAALWATNTSTGDPPTGPAPRGNTMIAGDVLGNMASMYSPNRRFELAFWARLTLRMESRWTISRVLTRRAGKFIWSSGPFPNNPPYDGACILQDDGNLVIYGADGQYVWDSGTNGNPGAYLVLQDDGNVVIYRADGVAIWATNSVSSPPPLGPPPSGGTMLAGEVLGPDQELASAGGRYSLIYQDDGNLVLYDNVPDAPRQSVWDTATDGEAGSCIMQGDGNFALYDLGGKYVWDSGTQGNPGARLIVQDDGQLVIYRGDGSAIWSSRSLNILRQLRKRLGWK